MSVFLSNPFRPDESTMTRQRTLQSEQLWTELYFLGGYCVGGEVATWNAYQDTVFATASSRGSRVLVYNMGRTEGRMNEMRD